MERPLVVDPDGQRFEFALCPVNYIDPLSRSYLALYAMFRQGLLFTDGGIGDQPAKYVDAMTFLDAIYRRHEAEAMEKAQRGANR